MKNLLSTVAAFALLVAPASAQVGGTGGGGGGGGSSYTGPFTSVTNPTSTLTRPADTTAYSALDLVASSTTAGSVVVPSFSVPTGGQGVLQRLVLATNATTGFDSSQFTVRLWRAAPTYTNGDNGAYAVATGAANHIASFTCYLSQYGDGAVGGCSINSGNLTAIKLASGTSVYWDIQSQGAYTPISGQTFTLTAEVAN